MSELDAVSELRALAVPTGRVPDGRGGADAANVGRVARWWRSAERDTRRTRLGHRVDDTVRAPPTGANPVQIDQRRLALWFQRRIRSQWEEGFDWLLDSARLTARKLAEGWAVDDFAAPVFHAAYETPEPFTLDLSTLPGVPTKANLRKSLKAHVGATLGATDPGVRADEARSAAPYAELFFSFDVLLRFTHRAWLPQFETERDYRRRVGEAFARWAAAQLEDRRDPRRATVPPRPGQAQRRAEDRRREQRRHSPLVDLPECGEIVGDLRTLASPDASLRFTRLGRAFRRALNRHVKERVWDARAAGFQRAPRRRARNLAPSVEILDEGQEGYDRSYHRLARRAAGETCAQIAERENAGAPTARPVTPKAVEKQVARLFHRVK